MSCVATACQCGHKLHKTVTLSWVNVLICIRCMRPAAIERNFYTPSWHGKLTRVSVRIFLSLLPLPPEIKVRLARETSTYHILCKLLKMHFAQTPSLASFPGSPLSLRRGESLGTRLRPPPSLTPNFLRKYFQASSFSEG